jgi:hypothetical protein
MDGLCKEELYRLIELYHAFFYANDISFGDKALFFQYYHAWKTEKTKEHVALLIWMVGVMRRDSCIVLGKIKAHFPRILDLRDELLSYFSYHLAFHSDYDELYEEMGLEGDVGSDKIVECFWQNQGKEELRKLLEDAGGTRSTHDV